MFLEGLLFRGLGPGPVFEEPSKRVVNFKRKKKVREGDKVILEKESHYLSFACIHRHKLNYFFGHGH